MFTKKILNISVTDKSVQVVSMKTPSGILNQAHNPNKIIIHSKETKLNVSFELTY